MPFKVQQPRVHDHTDGDLILIHKGILAGYLSESNTTTSSGSFSLSWFGVSTALLSASYLTEKFRDFGPISGSTVRAVFITGGLVSLGFTVHQLLKWWKRRKDHTATAILRNLTRSDSRPISEVETLVANTRNSRNKNSSQI